MITEKQYWENVYQTKNSTGLSWFEEYPKQSIEFIKDTRISKKIPIIDIGGGESKLVDELIKTGFENITVLDLSNTALKITKSRLEKKSNSINWIEGDIKNIQLPKDFFGIWHDRAVFHFLIKEEDRQYYTKQILRSVCHKGYIVISTFAEDGPNKCSGLPVERYSEEKLKLQFREDFTLIKSKKQKHLTPFNTHQSFLHSCFQRN